MEKKRIFCYGDSLTWGTSPEMGQRHALASRWPVVLAAHLGDKAEIITEALPGRTTVFDNPSSRDNRNGASMLPALLTSHHPLDLVIIMLGTNDLTHYVAGHAGAALAGMRRLVQLVRSHEVPSGERADIVPDILLIAPPPLVETDNQEMLAHFDGQIAQSKRIAPYYQALAQECGCGFFDAGSVAATSPLDGVHMDVENTVRLGEALVDVVKARLGIVSARSTPKGFERDRDER